MKSNTPSPSSWSVVALYLFGVLLFFWPFTDLVTNALPLQPGNLQWRYGFAGLMAAYLNTPTLGLVLLTILAYWLRHTRTLRVLSAFEILMAVGLIVVMATFALDLVQVRASRPQASQGVVLAGGLIAILKHFSAATVLGLLGIGSWRTASRLAARASKDASEHAGVVMKQRKDKPRPSGSSS